MAGTKISELIVTVDTSGYEAGAKRLEAADDAIIAKSNQMAAAMERGGDAVDQAGQRISQTDRKVSASVASFEKQERQLRTTAGIMQLYQVEVDKANAVLAKHPEFADRVAENLAKLGEKYLGTGRAAMEASAMQAAADAKAAQASAMAAAEAQAVRDRIDPAAAAQRRYGQEVQRVTGLVQAGALLEHEGAAAIGMAAAARDAEIVGLAKAGHAYEQTSVHAASLIRETRAVFDELSSGRSKQAIGSLTLLFTRGLGIGFGSFLAGAAALAIPAAVIISANEYDTALKRLDLDLRTTGRTIGLTRDGLLDIAEATRQASSLSGSEGRGIVDALAGSGNTGAGSLERAAALSRDFGAAMGKDAKTGAAALAEELANPSKALAELDKRFGIASVATIRYVRDAEAQGDVELARMAVLDALAPKLSGLADNQLTVLGRAWRSVNQEASEFWENLGRVGGVEETAAERIKRLRAALDPSTAPSVGNAIDGVVVPTENYAPSPRIRSQIQSQLLGAEVENTEGGLRASARATAEQQQALANGAVDLASKYDAFSTATVRLNNDQETLRKTLQALKDTGQATGPIFDILTKAYQNQTLALAMRNQTPLTPHDREMRGIANQSSALDLNPGARSLAAGRSAVMLEYAGKEQDDPAHAAELETEKLAKLDLLTKQHTTTISDETQAIIARTAASSRYVAAMSGGVSYDASLTAGYSAEGRSYGAEAARTRGQDPRQATSAHLDEQAAAGLAEMTAATARLRQETLLLSQADDTSAASVAASTRAREVALAFAEPMAKAAADEADAWVNGDLKRVASAQRLEDALRSLQAEQLADGTTRASSDRSRADAATSRDQQAQIAQAQLRLQLQPQISSHDPEAQASAARQMAELAERQALERQYGADLTGQNETLIDQAGYLAELNAQYQAMTQESKGYSKVIDDIGAAGGRAFETLTNSTGHWSERLHAAYQSLEQDIAKMIEKDMILLPLEQALGGGSGSGGGGGFGGLLTGAIGSLFGGGGADGVTASTYSAGTSDAFVDLAAGFAGGGDPPVGQASLVGEEGPELFMPKSAGTIIPAPQTAAMLNGGGGGDTHFHFNLHGGQGGVTREEVNQIVSQHAPKLIQAASTHARRSIFGEIQQGGSASKITGRRPF